MPTKPAKKTQKDPTLVTIGRKWQLAFIIVMVATQAIPFALTFWSILHYTGDKNSLSPAFIYGQNLYPFAFVLIGYLFAMSKVRGTIPRWFWAVFLAVIGVSVYYAVQLPLNYISNTFNLYPTGSEGNWWSGQGWIWTQMGVVLAMYTVVLALWARKSRRA